MIISRLVITLLSIITRSVLFWQAAECREDNSFFNRVETTFGESTLSTLIAFYKAYVPDGSHESECGQHGLDIKPNQPFVFECVGNSIVASAQIHGQANFVIQIDGVIKKRDDTEYSKRHLKMSAECCQLAGLMVYDTCNETGYVFNMDENFSYHIPYNRALTGISSDVVGRSRLFKFKTCQLESPSLRSAEIVIGVIVTGVVVGFVVVILVLKVRRVI